MNKDGERRAARKAGARANKEPPKPSDSVLARPLKNASKGARKVKMRKLAGTLAAARAGDKARVIVLEGKHSALGYASELLGKRVAREADFFTLVNEGLPVETVDILTRTVGIGEEAIATESTLRRRRKDQTRLSTEESERAVRFARVFGQALELFGNQRAAHHWMHTPRAFVPGHEPMSPVELCRTDVGARSVESMLLKTAYGMF